MKNEDAYANEIAKAIMAIFRCSFGTSLHYSSGTLCHFILLFSKAKYSKNRKYDHHISNDLFKSN